MEPGYISINKNVVHAYSENLYIHTINDEFKGKIDATGNHNAKYDKLGDQSKHHVFIYMRYLDKLFFIDM